MVKGEQTMKKFFKLYGFAMLIVLGVVLFFASTIGLAITSVVLCIVFRTGIWALLLIPLIFTVPFWCCVYVVIRD